MYIAIIYYWKWLLASIKAELQQDQLATNLSVIRINCKYMVALGLYFVVLETSLVVYYSQIGLCILQLMK